MNANFHAPKIIEAIIPESSAVRPGAVADVKKYIVIHNTGNYNEGATAEAHSKYLFALSENPERQVSWHYTVDDKEIYHHLPDCENAWHASDGSYGEGNYHGIGIEICVNGFPETYEGKSYEAFEESFKRAIANAAFLVARLMRRNGIGLDGVKQHYDFAPNKKNCPEQMRYCKASGTYTRDGGDLWRFFISEIKKQCEELEKEEQQ